MTKMRLLLAWFVMIALAAVFLCLLIIFKDPPRLANRATAPVAETLAPPPPLLQRFDCLKVDSVKLFPAPCAGGTCSITAASAVEFKAALIPTFEVTGHNSCAIESTGQDSAKFSAIVLAFYDAQSYRLGQASASIAPLKPGEKFRHRYEVPEDVRGSGTAKSVKVVTVLDIAK